jgi:hypothetical protein
VQVVEHDHLRHQGGAGKEVASGRRGDVVYERVYLQVRERIQRRLALDGEDHL